MSSTVVITVRTFFNDSVAGLTEHNDLGTFDYAYVGDSGLVDTIDYPNGQTTTKINEAGMRQEVKQFSLCVFFADQETGAKTLPTVFGRQQ